MKRICRLLVLSGLFFWLIPALASDEAKSDRFYAPISANGLHVYIGGLKGAKLPNSKSGEEGHSLALGKSQYSKGITAYLTYHSIQYGEEIRLSLVESASGNLITSVSIARVGGEGGTWGEVESWLIDVDTDGYLDVVTKEFGAEGVCYFNKDEYRYVPSQKRFVPTAHVSSSDPGYGKYAHLQMKLAQSPRNKHETEKYIEGCKDRTLTFCPPITDRNGVILSSREEQEGMIKGDTVNVREEPYVTSKSLKTLDQGTRVKVIQESWCVAIAGKTGKWVKIQNLDPKSNIKEGWVFDAYIQYGKNTRE